MSKAELVGLHDQTTDGTTRADLVPRPTNWCWSHFPTNQPMLISSPDQPTVSGAGLQTYQPRLGDSSAQSAPWCFRPFLQCQAMTVPGPVLASTCHMVLKPLYPSDSDFTAASASVDVLERSLITFSAAAQIPATPPLRSLPRCPPAQP